MSSAPAQVTASEVALNGVRAEAKVGQRATIDALNPQQALLNARVAFVTAQHDRVVAAYMVLSSIGRLSPRVLNLPDHADDPVCAASWCAIAGSAFARPDGRVAPNEIATKSCRMAIPDDIVATDKGLFLFRGRSGPMDQLTTSFRLVPATAGTRWIRARVPVVQFKRSSSER